MKEPGLGPFAGLDLRRPKGYTAASTATAVTPAEEEVQGDPCPRCESRDTKFCYYNNYNTSQPRHYCRSCRRYWTKGGSLRNVPVGGGSRKSSSSLSSSSSSAAASPKCAKNSKRRRVALAAPPEPEASTTDIAGAAHTEATANNGTIGDPATAEAAAQTEATANDTVDDPAIAADAATTETATTEDQTPAEDDVTADDPTALPMADGGFSDHPSLALGLAVADAGGKEAPDLSPFEWPSGCDLGSYWAPGVFADTDPVLFLNLP